MRSPRFSRRSAAFVAAAALAIAVSGFSAPGASAGTDPVASGQFNLSLSKAFRKQLRRTGLALRPKRFSLDEGSILDPVAGSGSLNLKGKLRFRAGGGAAVYRDLTVILGGKGGALQGHSMFRGGKRSRKPTELFTLGGGDVEREGFGARVRGVDMKLTKRAAKQINRKLGRRAVRAVRAATATLSEQPKTVEAVGGTVEFIPDPNAAYGSGTFASKLAAHCIRLNNDVTAIAPGLKSGPAAAPLFAFPITGGSVAPEGRGGTVLGAGGFRLFNGRPPNSPYDGTNGFGTCPGSPSTTMDQFDFSYNLSDGRGLNHVVITGPAPPLGGDQGLAVTSELNLNVATVSADAAAKTIDIEGAVARLRPGGAASLNLAFPNKNPDIGYDFAPGDLMGTVSMSIKVR